MLLLPTASLSPAKVKEMSEQLSEQLFEPRRGGASRFYKIEPANAAGCRVPARGAGGDPPAPSHF
jgi:hypothetical protein